MAVAQRHFEASYRLREEFNDPEGMAAALNHLAETALRQQNEVRAQQLYRQSLAIYQDISDKGGLARTYTGLGTVASKQNDLQTAQQYLQHALRLTMEIEYVPLSLSILNVIGELLLKSGRPEHGLIVLTFIRHHPSSDRAVQLEAQQRLESYRIATGKDEQDILAAAQAYAKDRTLQEVVAEVLGA
jgi:tetratricopeptide (TPR) repeat protein